MPGTVVCPDCGRESDAKAVERWGLCTHCGADLKGVGEEPIQESIPPGGGPPPPVVVPGQPEFAQPPPGAPSYTGGPWPPTFHPGVYEREEESPRFDLRNWVRMLFKPKEAFEDLYNHTSALTGVVIAIVLISATTIIGVVLMQEIAADVVIPENQSAPFGAESFNVTAEGVAITIGIEVGMFLVAGLFVFGLLSTIGNARRPNLGKTLGLIGYAKLPAFLIGIPLALVAPMILATVDWEEVQRLQEEGEEGQMGVPDWAGEVCGLGAFMVLLAIVMFIWGLWVHSHAAAVANDTAPGTAMGFTLLAWILTFVVETLLAMVVGLGFSIT